MSAARSWTISAETAAGPFVANTAVQFHPAPGPNRKTMPFPVAARWMAVGNHIIGSTVPRLNLVVSGCTSPSALVHRPSISPRPGLAMTSLAFMFVEVPRSRFLEKYPRRKLVIQFFPAADLLGRPVEMADRRGPWAGRPQRGPFGEGRMLL